DLEADRIENESEHYTDITVMAGFSYADAHNTGFSVLCVTDSDRDRARSIVTKLSDRIWHERHALYRPLPLHQVAEAIDHVLERLACEPKSEKPYVLLERSEEHTSE